MVKVSTAIISDSEHFDNTLIVTLFSCSGKTSLQIILFLQNYAIQNNYNRIQILTKEELFDYEIFRTQTFFSFVKKKSSLILQL